MIVETAVLTVMTWIVLMVVIPIAQKLGDFELPPLPERAWKLAIMAAALSLTAVLLDGTMFIIPWIVGLAVAWACLYFFFEADLFGVGMVYFVWMIADWILRMTITTILFRSQGA